MVDGGRACMGASTAANATEAASGAPVAVIAAGDEAPLLLATAPADAAAAPATTLPRQPRKSVSFSTLTEILSVEEVKLVQGDEADDLLDYEPRPPEEQERAAESAPPLPAAGHARRHSHASSTQRPMSIVEEEACGATAAAAAKVGTEASVHTALPAPVQRFSHRRTRSAPGY
eukprot:TRINITY_DN23199_c0_g1_i2.p2 TRINITY_DN23199_c0_g1~~TRINITY_DN23199_c0_g1_i2.p2  ORF type:complete len:174 (-),score=45.10 TRINITY_DN23199_c0_g1_i2:100-621(-)